MCWSASIRKTRFVAGTGRDLSFISYTPGVSSPYALCDKCHDLDGKLNLSGGGMDSVFGKHQLHVVTAGASCSVCHAAHGVQGGSVTNNRHLVDFDSRSWAVTENTPNHI